MTNGFYLPLSAGVKHPWNIDDQHYLLRNSNVMFVDDIAKKLNRTVQAVKSKASRMGCTIKLKPQGERDYE